MNAISCGRSVAAAVAAFLSGCALTHSGATPAGYSFAYQVDNREEIGLVQVFDDGAQTYLQLPADGDRTTRILDENGQSTTPIRRGAYLVVPGVHRILTLSRAEGVSHINREGGVVHFTSQTHFAVAPAAPQDVVAPAAIPGAAPEERTLAPGRPTARAESPGPSPAGSELAEMQATVMQLKGEIQALEREIADEQEALAQTRQMLASEARTETFVVHFANNSARAELSQQDIASIVKVGKNAQTFIIEGYTDAFYANDAGANLARARARNVAEILAGGGISREAMSIEIHAAGGFAKENSTDEGKAFNRRVAISFRFHETFSTS